MSVRIRYRRHSLKAKDGNLSPEGIELAVREARIAADAGDRYDMVFVSGLSRAKETVDYFAAAGTTSKDTYFDAPRSEIGSDELFAEMANAEFRKAVGEGLSNFEAVLKVHGEERSKDWARKFLEQLEQMLTTMGFMAMDSYEHPGLALAIGHSPVIEMTAWALGDYQPLSHEYARLGDLEGLVFVQDDNGLITVLGKISVEKEKRT